jgi:hypothetical protein
MMAKQPQPWFDAMKAAGATIYPTDDYPHMQSVDFPFSRESFNINILRNVKTNWFLLTVSGPIGDDQLDELVERLLELRAAVGEVAA